MKHHQVISVTDQMGRLTMTTSFGIPSGECLLDSFFHAMSGNVRQ
jgi:hypothetical protein